MTGTTVLYFPTISGNGARIQYFYIRKLSATTISYLVTGCMCLHDASHIRNHVLSGNACCYKGNMYRIFAPNICNGHISIAQKFTVTTRELVWDLLEKSSILRFSRHFRYRGNAWLFVLFVMLDDRTSVTRAAYLLKRRWLQLIAVHPHPLLSFIFFHVLGHDREMMRTLKWSLESEVVGVNIDKSFRKIRFLKWNIFIRIYTRYCSDGRAERIR